MMNKAKSKLLASACSSGLLDDILVIDMAQFLAGPFAALRLHDLGANVIKVERPDGGDICRRLYLTDTEIAGDSTLFHAINRGKKSLAVNLKNPPDMELVRKLITKADVLIQNFRPGVIGRLGLDFDTVTKLNPSIIYASISGYGDEGPWRNLPGQDLLAQARSGLMWLNGDEDHGPVPFGLAVGDLLAGNALVQGILAALVRRGKTGRSAQIETSLLEALIDFQFEVLSTHFNDGGKLPKRASFRNAHAYLPAPYGVYECADGWLALAMTPLDKLASLLDLPALANISANETFTRRDEIKHVLTSHLKNKPLEYWLDILQPADIWCSEVLNWPKLLETEAFKLLGMRQIVCRKGGVEIETTASPLRIDGTRAKCREAAPMVGQHNDEIIEFIGKD